MHIYIYIYIHILVQEGGLWPRVLGRLAAMRQEGLRPDAIGVEIEGP